MQHKIIIEHHIQRDILQRLSGGPLRFTALKPDGMEGNIFVYHTGMLRKLGLIEKSGDAYRLTRAGLTYIDQLSTKTFRPRLQPKIIAVLVVRSADGRIVVLRRNAEPYLGHYMLPSGKVHFGEALTAHATRELHEKTGLQAPLAYRGLATINIASNGSVVTSSLATVWEAHLPDEPELRCSDARFEAMWATEDAISTMMPGTREIIALCRQSEMFMVDLSIESDATAT